MTFWEQVGATLVALIAFMAVEKVAEHLFEWDPH